MNLGKAFTYVFDDPDYIKKVGIAALMSLIPIFGTFVVLGWGIEITRRVIRGEARPLPEWTDYGRYFTDGLKAFVVILVYLLPVILLNSCLQLAMIPLQNSSSGDVMAMAISGIALVSACLSIILGIGTGLMLPPALAIYAETGQIGAALRFGDVIALLRANFGVYVLTLVGIFISSFVAGLGMIACCVGVVVTIALSTAVNAHLYGQAYLAARGSAPRM